MSFTQNIRSKRLRITIRPFSEIRVTVPKGISLSAAKEFLLSKKNWILKQQIKVRSYEQEIEEARGKAEEINKKEACEYLDSRLHYLAEKFGFKFNQVTFRRQKTRWGSCSVKNNLSLNVMLFKLPRELQDYVILHELLHTRIKNHSSYFWLELGKILPGAKEFNKKLRKYKILAL